MVINEVFFYIIVAYYDKVWWLSNKYPLPAFLLNNLFPLEYNCLGSIWVDSWYYLLWLDAKVSKDYVISC